MHECYFLLDGVKNYPHGTLTVPKTGEAGDWDVLNVLSHFDGFTLTDFYNTSMVHLLPRKSMKFVINFLQTPVHNYPILTDHALDLLRNDSNVYLVLFNAFEYILREDELAKYISENNLPKNKTIVLTSNPESHGKMHGGAKYISINFWESYSRYHLKLMPETSITTPKEKARTIVNAERKYISLNRNVKQHRIWWYYSIVKNEMIKEGHVSYHLPKVEPHEYNELLFTDWVMKAIPKELHSDFKVASKRTMYARLLDKLDPIQVINYNSSIKKYYNDSLVSFITESDPRGNFITEKTYKAIVNMHPFFIVGNPDQHTLLRARGYHTFEDLFGVDKITNFNEATFALTRLKNTNLEDLKQIIQTRYMDKLIHNYNLFWSRRTPWSSIVNELNSTVDKLKNE